MLKLYVMSGSSHSQQAVQLLAGSQLKHQTVEVSGRIDLAAAFRDLGIREFPTLTNLSRRYEGLDQIRSFLEKNGTHVQI